MGNVTILVLGIVRVDTTRFTIVLVVRLAVGAFEARANLSSDSGTISNFELGHFLADFDDDTSYLVSGDQRQDGFSPATGDSVNVTAEQSKLLSRPGQPSGGRHTDLEQTPQTLALMVIS